MLYINDATTVNEYIQFLVIKWLFYVRMHGWNQLRQIWAFRWDLRFSFCNSVFVCCQSWNSISDHQESIRNDQQGAGDVITDLFLLLPLRWLIAPPSWHVCGYTQKHRFSSFFLHSLILPIMLHKFPANSIPSTHLKIVWGRNGRIIAFHCMPMPCIHMCYKLQWVSTV